MPAFQVRINVGVAVTTQSKVTTVLSPSPVVTTFCTALLLVMKLIAAAPR